MVMSFSIGDCQLFLPEAGSFALDAGAYFGIVPKLIWQKLVTVDEFNRCRIAINPLLIKTPQHTILVDPGLGDKYGDKLRFIYDIKTETNLLNSLQEINVSPADIDIVVATHMHFDHIGALTRINEHSEVAPTFPNAVHYFQAGEWDDATNPDERTKASYFSENFLPLQERGLVTLIEGDVQITPHVRVEKTGGHTKHHQIVIFEAQGQTVVYPGDILPSVDHLPLPYVMALDLYPVDVMAQKRNLYRRAIERDWIICIDHANGEKAGRIRFEGKRYMFEPLIMAES
ncbi:MAG: MBL fold metallo-hydrolase [Candidatus Zhuqueibacterota bacterium]